ncbi:hypothetical protein KJ785_02955 [Patescibacteria group bacterium]|nr:hypothetical protein [Patescibacteria group bacterium]
MQDIQEIFNRIQDAKKKQKDIRTAYKDALASSLEYQELTEKMKIMREKKKEIEQTTKEQFSSEFIKLDDLKIDIESDQEMLNDMALNKVMKGESIQIKDEYDNEYEPLFSVKFRKM